MTASPALPRARSRRAPLHRLLPDRSAFRDKGAVQAGRGVRALGYLLFREGPVPGRRGLQVCLGLVWLLDALLQFQPFMFGSSFVTQEIQPAIAGNPAVIAGPATWASYVMLHHIAIYNAIFAAIQLLIAAGILYRRTVRLALAASVVWALSVWWFGEGLGGILTGASPLAGFPGGVVLYSLIAVLLWPSARGSAAESPATSGALGARAPKILWLLLWGSCTYFLLLPSNRVPGTIAGLFTFTDGQPGWLVWIMNGMSVLAGQRDTEISLVLAAACALVAVGVFARRTIRAALIVAAALALLFWLAEGLGGIFTGQGTDPNTGPLLILLAACFWPRRVAGTVTRGQMATPSEALDRGVEVARHHPTSELSQGTPR
jgi:hypothetical protein